MRSWRSALRMVGLATLVGMGLAVGLLIGASPSSGDPSTTGLKLQQVSSLLPPWIMAGGDPTRVTPLLQSVDGYLRAGDPASAEQVLDQLLVIITPPPPPPYVPPPGPYLGQPEPVSLGVLRSTAEIVAHSSGYIYAMDHAGQQVTQITRERPRSWEHVAVSYDRRYIVGNAHRDTDPARSESWLFDLQNGTETRLLPLFYSVGEGGVSWDPQGHIYFAGKSAQSDNIEVFRVKLDGTGLARLTNSPGFGKFDVGVSQDGTMITYVVFVPEPEHQSAHTEIWVSNSDGSNARRVYTGGAVFVASVHDPELSPDNSKVVFSKLNTQVPPNFPTEPGANTAHDLWTCDLNGQNVQRLTAPGPISILPNWQPSGNLIVYTEASERDQYAGASIVGADGADQPPTRPRRDMSSAKWIPPLSP